MPFIDMIVKDGTLCKGPSNPFKKIMFGDSVTFQCVARNVNSPPPMCLQDQNRYKIPSGTMWEFCPETKQDRVNVSTGDLTLEVNESMHSMLFQGDVAHMLSGYFRFPTGPGYWTKLPAEMMVWDNWKLTVRNYTWIRSRSEEFIFVFGEKKPQIVYLDWN